MGQDIWTKGLADAQNETQENPRQREDSAENFGLKAHDNHHNGLRECPLIYKVWTDSEDRDQCCQQNQSCSHPSPEYSNSWEVLANALIEFRSHSQKK